MYVLSLFIIFYDAHIYIQYIKTLLISKIKLAKKYVTLGKITEVSHSTSIDNGRKEARNH